ncbi:hypothetical protein [Streptomyces sp. NBC_01089]|uniref:hypothetical protein n=1 Tax=Streptomyces sp. NBC_01089 TaxID=2903747 RepID=UPI00386AA798|nr:hypothetical protein OG510_13040 [Streptomyces sp. NBC_01089]
MSHPAFVYDAGMLIALDRQDRTAHTFHQALTRLDHPPVVPLPVLAQVWRPGRWTPLSRCVPQCTVFGTREARVAGCGPCDVGHLESDARRAGQLLTHAAIPAEKRPDAVDALAMVIAARHVSSVVVTSDVRDLVAYRDALTEAEQSIRILPVSGLAEFMSGKRVTL